MKTAKESLLLYLCRHGECYANYQNRIGGDTSLTERGKHHAETVASFLREKTFDIIYTSTLKRAMQTTASIVPYHPSTPVVALEQLVEVYHGPIEGMTWEEFKRDIPDEFERRNREKYCWKIRGGESYKDAAENRIQPFLNKVLKERGKILIVSHGGVMRIILHKLCGYYQDIVSREIYHLSIFEIKIPNIKNPAQCSVMHYDLQNQRVLCEKELTLDPTFATSP